MNTTAPTPKTLTIAAHNWTDGNVTVRGHNDHRFEVYGYEFALTPQGDCMALLDVLADCKVAIVFQDNSEWVALAQGQDFTRAGSTAIEASARLIANLY